MSKYEVGNIVNGCVTGIESYGIFVNFDEYYSGLIHISEISNSFVRSIKDYVDLGETIKVKILDVNHDSFQLKLSIKGIDYRITNKRKTRIKENGLGFLLLKEHLDYWIKKKIEEK